jgi:endonuclease YncB( thermonuclease family)
LRGGETSSTLPAPASMARVSRGIRILPSLLPLLLLVLASADPADAEFFEGRVVRVFDGDTIEVLVGRQPRRVRLSGIDTPERGQPWAERAKQALARRVLRKEVRVNDVGTDRYGRTLGEVYADNVCVGCELVREGNAWVYRRYTNDEVLYELEAEARAAHRGLWSLPEAQRVPPWEWRHVAQEDGRSSGPEGVPTPSREAPSSPSSVRRTLVCGNKLYCSEMASCAEARFYLEHCGLERIDGDGDGVPCASLCR